MEWAINSTRVPIKSWCNYIDAATMIQAIHVTELPFVYPHVALMADGHLGYGVPIGCVFAADGAVVPNAVGVDIGCGVITIKTAITADKLTPVVIRKIFDEVRKEVPTGYHHHKTAQEWGGFHDIPNIPIIRGEIESAKRQLGTLGGGNHFIEIQKDEDDCVWLMIHSGSRNFGYKIAQVYHALAKLDKSHTAGKDLAYLEVGTQNADDYLIALNFALEFAAENREIMMEKFTDAVDKHVELDILFHLNVHHNYAAKEVHFGKELFVHRKGAISAKVGEWGIIPGSQGTASYIVKGKGNPGSFNSCSHGAGRKMGRAAAKEKLDFTEEVGRMDRMGIVHSVRAINNLDEAPGAYKDIDLVMYEQQDLVEVMFKLTPLGTMKG